MNDFSFKNKIHKQYQTRLQATAPIKEVDAYVFCTSSKYLGERLFPWQSLAIKVYYGLWEKYPITEEEQAILDKLKERWHINIDLTKRNPNQHVEIFILVLGRRSGKSSLISFIQTYEVYKLICKGDPQKYYGIRRRHPIQVVNCAKDGEQAQDPFRLCKDNIRRIPFFSKYVDWSKDNESELRLFTPADLYENDQIRKYNATRPQGTQKKNLLEGSILISAFTTSAASKRGKAIILLILDEFAHFDRAKSVSGGITDEDILQEMPQTDYAMLKALSPSTKDFNIEEKGIFDGKIIMISSPREKGGEFYKHYCLAGGSEQANPNREDKESSYLMFQLATWDCNSKYTQKALAGEFKKDPVGANMEYGSHFGEPSTSFIDSEKIDQMINQSFPMIYVGKWKHQYIISVDPASKGDTYAIAWGHAEGEQFIIDGLHGFRPKVITNEVTNRPIRIPVNATKEVAPFIKQLAGYLSREGILLEIVFDQWNSSDSIAMIKAAGFTAVETFFTNKYKGAMYTNFLEKLNLGAVHCFGKRPVSIPPGMPAYSPGWLEQTKLELKHLTKTTSGDTVFYKAPDNGPVQTDDFADVCGNLVHRLTLYQSGDRQIYKELYKQTGKPLKRPLKKGKPGVLPGNLFTGPKRTRQQILNDLQNRIRR